MYDLFHGFMNFLRPDEIRIDNFCFKLHYRLTSMFLICCSMLVTCKQFFGDPIHCFTAFKDEVPEGVLNNFCWLQSTFTLPAAYNKRVGVDVVSPGVWKYTPGQDRVFHQYYQWVCFFLFFQAMFFYLPRFIWKALEGGKIKQVVTGLNHRIMTLDDKDIKIKQLAAYFVDNLGAHRLYASSYFMCELFNFVNVVGQIFFTDTFLGGEFTTYGSKVVQFAQMDQQNRTDPMIQVFPRMTKCTFHKFGPSGDIQLHDALCVLSLNVINEKIFVFIWFWFVVLAIISGLTIIYRLIWIAMEKLRWEILLKINRRSSMQLLKRMSHKFIIGDWFVLHLLSKNMHSLHFREFVKETDRIIENVTAPSADDLDLRKENHYPMVDHMN